MTHWRPIRPLEVELRRGLGEAVESPHEHNECDADKEGCRWTEAAGGDHVSCPITEKAPLAKFRC
jgi:hypothetical protein